MISKGFAGVRQRCRKSRCFLRGTESGTDLSHPRLSVAVCKGIFSKEHTCQYADPHCVPFSFGPIAHCPRSTSLLHNLKQETAKPGRVFDPLDRYNRSLWNTVHRFERKRYFECTQKGFKKYHPI